MGVLGKGVGVDTKGKGWKKLAQWEACKLWEQEGSHSCPCH